MYQKTISNTGLQVSALGLGCMSMSEYYGATDDIESLATLEAAIEHGITHFDTSDIYGMGHNEKLLSQLLKKHRDRMILASKFGIIKDPETRSTLGINGSPAYVKSACEASLRRLNIDTIDLYYLHRIDSNTLIEETVGAMAELVKQGKVRYLGLSAVSAATIRRAHRVHPITAIQSEYSIWTRNPESEVLPLCQELGIGFAAYSPLGRGFLTGKIESMEGMDEKDLRRSVPRFETENLKKNLEILKTIKTLAAEKNCSAAQIALAWVLAQGTNITAIPGTKRRSYLKENCEAVNIQLETAELESLNALINQVVGERYTEATWKILNMED